jgi:hypothetical protein
MQVTCYREKNLSYVVIDDYITGQEYEAVLSESKDLKRLSANSEITDSAKYENGEYKKTGTGVFLDNLYTNNRNASPTLCAGQKIFNNELCLALEKFDVVFSFICQSNIDTMLINYYTPGQVYKAHKDTCNITAITLLGWGEFTGGGLCFPEQDVKIEFKQGRTIVFPSCAEHSSESIGGTEDSCRVSIAHFIWNQGEVK